jgi:hypothetical protein
MAKKTRPYDQAVFDDVRHYSSRLVASFAARDNMLEEIRRMFAMEWTQVPTGDWIKPTMSPTAYNTTMGAIRLLTATEPQLSVPYEESDGDAKLVSDKIEQAAKAMLSGSGRISLRPFHYEVVFSSVLFGETCLAVTKTADLVKIAKKAKIKKAINRMEWVNKQSPYLFQVFNPMTCYPQFDKFGLRSMLRRTRTTWGEVLDTWGMMAETAYPGTHEKDEVVVVNDHYDWENRVVWLDGGLGGNDTAGQTRGSQVVGGQYGDTPILAESHGLSFMPVISQLGEGSFLFDEPEKQRIPFLYALWKSGLWKRENLTLTVVYSLVFALGSSPLMKRTTPNPGSPLTIDRRIPGGVIDLAPDERLEPLNEKVFDSSHLTVLELAERLATESTIPKMALGAPPQNALAFSAISLLTQSGRLPLVAPKELSGHAISNALITALRWMKADAKKETYFNNGKWIELDPGEIPDNIVINVNLEPELPQDKLQQANIANLITSTGLTSKRWAREKILTVGQSDHMEREIFQERRLSAELEGVLKSISARSDAKAQAEIAKAAQMSAPPPPPGPSPAAPPPQGPLPGMPPAPPAGDLASRPMSEGEMEGQPPVGDGGPWARMRSSALPPGNRVGPGNPLLGPLPPPGETL